MERLLPFLIPVMVLTIGSVIGGSLALIFTAVGNIGTIIIGVSIAGGVPILAALIASRR